MTDKDFINRVRALVADSKSIRDACDAMLALEKLIADYERAAPSMPQRAPILLGPGEE